MKVWLVEMRDYEDPKCPWEPLFRVGKLIEKKADRDVYHWLSTVYDHKNGVYEAEDYARRSHGEDFNPYCFRYREVEFDPEQHHIQHVKLWQETVVSVKI